MLGSSWIEARKSEASLYGTAKANVVSCEIGDKGFQVGGRGLMELLSGIDTSCAKGAVRGNVFDRESGKTKVITIMC